MPFIGTQPEVGGYSVLDNLTASATASYTLQLNSANFVPASANQLLVSLNGVIQKPGSSFTVSGSTLTFSSALDSSDSIDFILAMGEPLLVGTPSDGTVTSAKLDTNIAVAGTLGITGESTLTGGAKVNTIKHTGGTTAMTIDSTGRLTQPAKPSFFAHGSTGTWQSVSSGGIVTELDTTDHNIGSCYDTSNGRFTVPITGVYCLQFNLYIKQTSNNASWSVYHNGSEFAAGGFPLIRVLRNDSDANDETIGCTWTYRYTAGTYIEIRASGSTSEYVPYRSYFSGFLVG